MQKILRKIATEPLPRVLLVHGPETVWHDQVYNALKNRNAQDSLAEWNWSVFHGTKDFDLDELLVELGMVPWGGSTKIVVMRKGELVPAATMEKLATWLEQHPEANCLALFLEKVDKRWKYLRLLRPMALEIECVPLQGETLVRYVLDSCTEQGKEMKRATAEFFLERVGVNLLVIHNELEKLVAWSAGRKEITKHDVQIISSLSPGQIASHTVFQMTDAIIQKNRQEALDVLHQLMSAGEPALRILPLIERQLRLVLAAKTSTVGLEETAKQIGETNSYALKKLHSHARKYDLEEILAGFEAVLHADGELKLGVPGEQVLADLIVKLTRTEVPYTT